MEIKSFDRDSFDAVYTAYAGKVHRNALTMTRNKDVAEDIMQDVFMKFYQHMSNVNVEKVESWLLSVTYHMASNYIRDHKRETYVEDVDEFMQECEDELDRSIAYIENLEEKYIRKLTKEERSKLAQEIYADLYSKNERWHEAITVTYILERPQKEVADTMGVSLGALQLMLFRARNWIRKQYEKRYEQLDKL